MTVAWFVLIIAVLLGVQTFLYRRFSLRKLSYHRYFEPGAVFEGDLAEMVEVLQNNKLLPLPWIRMESRLNSRLLFSRQVNLNITLEQFHSSVFFLGAFQKITRRHKVLCTHRGHYCFYQTTLTCGDLFGMNDRSMEFKEKVEVYVYPQIPSFQELPTEALRWQGDVSARRWILPDPVLVNGIREYRQGDPLKDIHWNATARTGKLQVKTRDFTVAPRTLVILNVQCREELWGLMEPWEQETVEPSVRCAAALLDWAISQGIEAGLLTNGGMEEEQKEEYFYLPPAGGDASLEILLRALAELRIENKIHFSTLLERLVEQEFTGMDMVIVSPYWSDTLEDRLPALRAKGNTVTVINMESEVDAGAQAQTAS